MLNRYRYEKWYDVVSTPGEFDRVYGLRPNGELWGGIEDHYGPTMYLDSVNVSPGDFAAACALADHKMRELSAMAEDVLSEARARRRGGK